MSMEQNTYKGFIKDWQGKTLLPITRGELVLDEDGYVALHSTHFLAEVPDASLGYEGRPGLMTAAEKALIQTLVGNSGTGSGGSIGDIYTKLGLINSGLYINDTLVKFYTDQGPTPIYISGSEGIIITEDPTKTQNYTIGLASIGQPIELQQIIQSINVDKYGRVISVAGTAKLSSDKLPDTISGKTLSGCKVDSALTGESDDLAIAHKSYVDEKFNTVTITATGALKFDGIISSEDNLNTLIANLSSRINYYYKVTKTLTISGNNTYDGTSQTVKPGDTIIVYKVPNTDNIKLVIIPSGDEVITTISVAEGDKTVMQRADGQVKLTFNSPFKVTSETGSKEAKISLPTLSANDESITVGLLSKTDYDNFQAYSSKSVSYTPIITSTTPNHYEIGAIDFDGGSSKIYGKYTIYDLTVVNGYDENTANPSKDPKLVFGSTDTGTQKSVQFKGSNGILIQKSNDAITFQATNKVSDNSDQYLRITNNSEFEILLGKTNEDGTTTDGLVSYSKFLEYTAYLHQSSVQFKVITGSLKPANDSTDSEYWYGNTNLVNAISVTI